MKLIERFLKESIYADSTKRNVRYILLKYVQSFFLTQSQIEIKDIFISIYGDKGIGSYNSAYHAGRAFFKFLIENGHYSDKNPFDLIKAKRPPQNEPDPFSKEELDEILAKCLEKDRFLYELLTNTGIRVDELVHLKFEDFNLSRKLLHVKSRTSGGGAKENKQRDIPLPRLLFQKYEVYLSDFRSKRKTDSSYVFINRSGYKTTTRSIQRKLKGLGLKIKIHIKPHRFRYTYAQNLAREGIHITVIKELLGHASIETTARYIRIEMSDMRKAQDEATPLGKQSKELENLDNANRKKQDLILQIKQLLANQKDVLEQVRDLE